MNYKETFRKYYKIPLIVITIFFLFAINHAAISIPYYQHYGNSNNNTLHQYYQFFECLDDNTLTVAVIRDCSKPVNISFTDDTGNSTIYLHNITQDCINSEIMIERLLPYESSLRWTDCDKENNMYLCSFFHIENAKNKKTFPIYLEGEGNPKRIGSGVQSLDSLRHMLGCWND